VKINKARNKTQADLKFYENKIKEIKGQLIQANDNLEGNRKQLERADIEISRLNNEKDNLNAKLANSERHYDQSQKQYEEKIIAITEISDQNKKKKEVWASNYEKEQRAHSETLEELIKTQTKLKETEMSLNNIKISAKSFKKMNSDNEERNVEINNQLMKLAIENEKHMRESKTNSKLLEIHKRESAKKISDLEDQIIHEKENLLRKEQTLNMSMEDAFSLTLRWEDKYRILQGKFDDLKLEDQSNLEKIQKLEEELAEKTKTIEEINKELEEVKVKKEDFKNISNLKEKEILKLKSDLVEQDKNHRKQKMKEVRGLQDKLKKAEFRIRDLTKKTEIETIDKGTQKDINTSVKGTSTTLTAKEIEDIKAEVKNSKEKIVELEKRNEANESKKQELDQEIKRLVNVAASSRPDTGRKLSPKYRGKMTEIGSSELEEVRIWSSSF